MRMQRGRNRGALRLCLMIFAAWTAPAVAQETGQETAAQPRSSRFVVGTHALIADIDLAVADERAMNVPAEKSGSMGTLVRYLTQDLDTDVEKFRALFVWVADNIDYDGKALKSRNVEAVDVEKAFLLRKGVCAHYSALLERLCAMAGLRCITIKGRATGYPKEILLDDTLHAWTAVRLRGAWYLADSTWAAGWLDDTYSFHRSPTHDRYFLNEPSDFLKSHFPDDPVWQLVDDHWSFSDFLANAALD